MSNNNNKFTPDCSRLSVALGRLSKAPTWLALPLLAFTSFANAGFINFEEGFTDQEFVQSVDTGDNTVHFSVYDSETDLLIQNGAYIAQRGGQTTAFARNDRVNPFYEEAWEGYRDRNDYYLTDEYNGPVESLSYRFDFENAITDLSLDLFDFRADGGADYGDTATLYLYDELDNIIAEQVYEISQWSPNGNVVNFDLSLDNSLAYSAYLDFSGIDIGTAIDNISFTTAPEPETLFLLFTGLACLFYIRKRASSSEKSIA